jgi:hypothetical protein
MQLVHRDDGDRATRLHGGVTTVLEHSRSRGV